MSALPDGRASICSQIEPGDANIRYRQPHDKWDEAIERCRDDERQKRRHT